jgi:hypothetical protein
MAMTPREADRFYARLKFIRWLVEQRIINEGDIDAAGPAEGLGAFVARLHPVLELAFPEEAASGPDQVADE